MIDSSAVLLYGFEIPPSKEVGDQDARIDRVLRTAGLSKTGISYAMIGPWDNERLYLTAQYHEASSSEPLGVELEAEPEVNAKWDGLLNMAARALGVFEHERAGWLLLVSET